MAHIRSDFQLLLALSSMHVDKITAAIIDQLKTLTDENFLLSGEDSGLKNTWEEICVQAQGQTSIYWEIYVETINNFIVDEFNKQPHAVQILVSYIGSIDSEYAYGEDEDPYCIFHDAAIKEIMDALMMKAGNYDNRNISRYLDDDFSRDEDEEEDDDETESEDDEADAVDEKNSKQPIAIPEENILEAKVREYVLKRFSPHIQANNIRYGRASFTVDMLVSGSIETWKLNPDKDIYNIVDYMFDYFCT